jgi:uncharacterized protein
MTDAPPAPPARYQSTLSPTEERPMSGIARVLTVLATCAAGAALSLAAGAAAAAENAPSAYVAPHITHEPYGEVHLVVPLTTDDKDIQGMKLRNITNGLKAADDWKGKFTVRVVLYAKGVTLLKNPDSDTREKLDALRKAGVRFLVCGNTLREQDIDFHALYKVTEADVVPSGFAEVAYLQVRKHYAVDPVN